MSRILCVFLVLHAITLPPWNPIGATLPYLIHRRVPLVARNQCTVFVTLFEAFAPGKAVVKTVKPLDVSAAEADNTVAFAVETDGGADYVVSCLQARPVRLETPAGPLEMNGRFAVVSIQGGKAEGRAGEPPKAAALFTGSSLRWNGKDVLAE